MAFKYIDAGKARLATAALSGRIYLGVPGPAGKNFIGVTKDVTNYCLKAVVDKVQREESNVLVITENGVATYELEVRRIGEKQ